MYIPTVLPPHLIRLPGLGTLLFLAWAACTVARPRAAEAGEPSTPGKAPEGTAAASGAAPANRTFRAFLPRPGAAAEEPSGHIIQLLLDRQEKPGYESYLLQVLFRGAPARAHVQRVFPDRVEVDFLDTGKPTMRLARVRGGVVRATALEELHYRDADRLKQMVRLVLYTEARPDLRIRNTLDRTLIHFRVERSAAAPPEKSPKSVLQEKSAAVPAEP